MMLDNLLFCEIFLRFCSPYKNIYFFALVHNWSFECSWKAHLIFQIDIFHKALIIPVEFLLILFKHFSLLFCFTTSSELFTRWRSKVKWAISMMSCEVLFLPKLFSLFLFLQRIRKSKLSTHTISVIKMWWFWDFSNDVLITTEADETQLINENWRKFSYTRIFLFSRDMHFLLFFLYFIVWAFLSFIFFKLRIYFFMI